MKQWKKWLGRALALSLCLGMGSGAMAAEKPVHVTVHDPSILEVEGEGYYILGSHTASAFSKDLIAWEQLNIDYGKGTNVPFYGNLDETFAVPFAWAGRKDADAAKFAIWAPDIIYNPYYVWEDGQEGAYMLYACTSSTWRRSCICYLVSREVEGPYEYADTIVYSGFTKNGETDGNSTRDTSWDGDALNLKRLVELGSANGGIDEVSDQWFSQNGGWNHTYAPNAIDPNLFFDASGERLYMSYGSWSGGMWILELDRTTGEPIYPGVDSVDEVSGNYVDRYFGVHIIGGDHASGEGPYIRYDAETGYYYFYCTYGGLASAGGYNMRLFRSKEVTGPYLDAAGLNAAENKGNQDKYGIKLIGNYAFYNQLGKKAAGHNSQLIDSQGRRFLVYHQRFDTTPQLEAHEVRVHQQFLNESDWPVTAVYEYRGEEPSHYEAAQVVGTYELVNHGNKTDGDMIVTSLLFLNEDGSVDGALAGTWEKKDSGRGYDYLTISTGEATYQGYFFEQLKETNEDESVMTFSLIGDDNLCLWGSKTEDGGGTMAVETAGEELKKEIMATVKAYGTLPAEFMGCSIRWMSSEPSVITEEGQVLAPAEKTKVTLEAEISNGSASITRSYNVTVKPQG